MPRCARASALLLALLAAACTRGAPELPAPYATSGGNAPNQPGTLDQDIAASRAVVNTFLALEARGYAAADTLLAPGADFIMTGIKVTARPRLAGLNGPGDVAVEEAAAEVAAPLAWLVVGYRFAGRTPDLAERARATFVLEKQRAGWRIRHVHSSMVERW